MSQPVDNVPAPEIALLELMRGLDARLIRRGDDKTGIPYLWRAYLGERKDLTKSIAGGFLHRFVSSDEQEWHCHPWEWSYAFIIKGAYREQRVRATAIDTDLKTASAVLDGNSLETAEFHPGDTNLILVETFHRVDLLTPEVWTLFVHGPRVQDWGFVPLGRYDEVLPMRLMTGSTRDRLQKEDVR